MNHIKTIEAINRLVPFAKVTLIDDEIVWEDDRRQPTIQEIEEEIEKFSYYNQRKDAYPSIADQLDIMYHHGYEAWKEEITKIKSMFPKPDDII